MVPLYRWSGLSLLLFAKKHLKLWKCYEVIKKNHSVWLVWHKKYWYNVQLAGTIKPRKSQMAVLKTDVEANNRWFDITIKSHSVIMVVIIITTLITELFKTVIFVFFVYVNMWLLSNKVTIL